MKRFFVGFFLLLMSAPLLQAQTSLTLEDIYSKGVYSQKGYGPVRWMKDSKVYSTLETNNQVGGKDIVKYDARTGKRSLLFSAEALIPANASQPLAIADYVWSEDNSKLLIFTNTRRVWRYNTRGDYWVMDVATKKLKQLGAYHHDVCQVLSRRLPCGFCKP